MNNYMHNIIKAQQIKSIILLFGQQTEPPRSLLRPRNSHVNRRKKKN